MDDIKNVQRRYKSTVGMEKLKEALKEKEKQEEFKREQIKEIMKDYSYFDKLTCYLNPGESFFDDDYKHKNGLDKSTVDMMIKLFLFYEGIAQYADKNFYYPYPEEFGNHYVIKHNGSAFKVGILAGQGVTYYCERISAYDKNIRYINLSDIIKNRPRADKDEIAQSFKTIQENINQLFDKGIPTFAVVSAVQRIVDNATYKNAGDIFVRKHK